MSKAKVDIGIACSAWQSWEWWVPLISNLLTEQETGNIEIGRIHAVGSALPDHNKNFVVNDNRIAPDTEGKRDNLTDANRARIAQGFLDGHADWIFSLDDDTVPPKGTITHLMSSGHAFVGGVYFLAKPPHNPIAYYRQDDGTYAALMQYPRGAIVQVDSIGMGCTLIHRSVFEDIMSEHKVFVRPNGSLIPVLKSDITTNSMKPVTDKTRVVNGVLQMPLHERSEQDQRPFPFYALEYGRTEDHHFCELAASVGHKPYLDTEIICDHYKLRAINKQAHDLVIEQLEGIRQSG